MNSIYIGDKFKDDSLFQDTFVPPNPFSIYDAYPICEKNIQNSALARVCKPLLPLSFQTAYEVCLDLIGVS